MSMCPHCHFPLIPRTQTPSGIPGVVSCMVSCTHCEAILRIEITTLKEPNLEKLQKGKGKKNG